jgi:hypothetical protein
MSKFSISLIRPSIDVYDFIKFNYRIRSGVPVTGKQFFKIFCVHSLLPIVYAASQLILREPNYGLAEPRNYRAYIC